MQIHHMRNLAVLFSLILSLSASAGPSVAVVGAHPDDLEAALGAVILLKERGYDIHVIDFTRGERGLGEAGCADGSTARKRVAEEERACAKLGAKLHFLDEIDGEAYAPMKTCRQLADLLAQIRPAAVFTHWPLDTHSDHVMTFAAVHKAVNLMGGATPEIYYMEEPHQSKNFQPDHYVYINHVREKKNEIIRCYECQNRNDGLVRRKMRQSEERGRDVWMPARHCEAYASFNNRAYGRPPYGTVPKVFADMDGKPDEAKKEGK